MGFFQDLKEDLSQAVNEMIPDEEGTAGKPIIPSLQEDDDLAEIEAMFRKKEETGEGAVAGESVTMLDKETVAELVKESVKEPVREDRERKLDMNTIFNQSYKDEVSTITAGMTINVDISSQGSLELMGCIHGSINVTGKISVTGIIDGNSQASEVYAESAKITGEIRSEGTVKVGKDSVIIGNIFAISAVIAGAVKGDIDVQGPVVLDSTAVVMGNIKSKSVQINNGAVVEGVCSQCYADVNPISFFDEIKKSG